MNMNIGDKILVLPKYRKTLYLDAINRIGNFEYLKSESFTTILKNVFRDGSFIAKSYQTYFAYNPKEAVYFIKYSKDINLNIISILYE